jgi:hypothetical protein
VWLRAERQQRHLESLKRDYYWVDGRMYRRGTSPSDKLFGKEPLSDKEADRVLNPLWL